MGVNVILIALAFTLALITRYMQRKRKITKSLGHPGRNYARPQPSRFEDVGIEMNQPLAVRGTSDGYETIDTSENTNPLIKKKRRDYEHAADVTFLNEYKTRDNGTSEGYENIDTSKNTNPLIKKKRRNYEHATDVIFLNEYKTRKNGNRDRSHDLQNRTANFAEEIETNDRLDPDQRTDFTFAKLERKYKIEPVQIVRDTSTFSIENASFLVESLETDNVNVVPFYNFKRSKFVISDFHVDEM
eukprot:XP_019919406.1 PREDICTED: uncharacterized protein LOC105319653 [Crassostrea gigas]